MYKNLFLFQVRHSYKGRLNSKHNYYNLNVVSHFNIQLNSQHCYWVQYDFTSRNKKKQKKKKIDILNTF